MLDHEVNKLHIRGSNATPPSKILTGNAGDVQERRESHAVDVRIGAFLQQHLSDFHVAADEGTQQRCCSRAKERIAEASSLTLETTHVELRIHIYAGCQQEVDDLGA